ncbi:muramoyltetrapeptide carboxypeptidase LdcA [Psychroflexus torquis ATCC 700755]|uniref:Muramoyltetrapeptide carboxypeptidase LdcA n=1 Tax=Psychroflexus torquis (strain ATCC 700755 / CIP 106069 / ACAM 623) TaxID=313595 RepID=K4IE19_PSYTT|nr:LD-carboxypeptidase [Psychroflexus torquis]AFU68644.1 muramoyltetrapeptide carboxypeptidase LdcA [Psychroflexus torquis ATCC 700755]
MSLPPPLQTGDQVAIIATARYISKAEIQPAIDLLKSWGLKPILGSSIGQQEHQFAGSDQERAKDFQNQLDHPDIKAIWCAKGGYGSVRIIDHIDFSSLKKQPKWIIGYSDVTAIHMHLQSIEIASLHAQMAFDIEAKSNSTSTQLQKVLFGENAGISSQNIHPLQKNGTASGEIIGGNLSVLYSLLGSSSAPSFKGKILFLEDLDEYLYHIDRIMQNLKRSGILKVIKGLIVGGMTQMNDNTVPFGKTAEEIISEAVQVYDYPVCFQFPVGHTQDNLPLIFGKVARLEVSSSQIQLTY